MFQFYTPWKPQKNIRTVFSGDRKLEHCFNMGSLIIILFEENAPPANLLLLQGQQSNEGVVFFKKNPKMEWVVNFAKIEV